MWSNRNHLRDNRHKHQGPQSSRSEEVVDVDFLVGKLGTDPAIACARWQVFVGALSFLVSRLLAEMASFVGSSQDLGTYNKYRPEMGESIAESRERSNLIYQEHQRLKKEKEQKVKNSQTTGFQMPETQICISNNRQELHLETPLAHAPEVLHVIMDTGADLSVFTGSVTSAWTNLRPCLYSVTGCFRGERHNDLQIGQFMAS